MKTHVFSIKFLRTRHLLYFYGFKIYPMKVLLFTFSCALALLSCSKSDSKPEYKEMSFLAKHSSTGVSDSITASPSLISYSDLDGGNGGRTVLMGSVEDGSTSLTIQILPLDEATPSSYTLVKVPADMTGNWAMINHKKKTYQVLSGNVEFSHVGGYVEATFKMTAISVDDTLSISEGHLKISK